MPNIEKTVKEQFEKYTGGVFNINLSNLGINDDGMVEIQEVLQELLQNNLQITSISIDLSQNIITAKGCKMLNLLPKSKLQKADLSYNYLGDASIEFLVATSITDLNISSNGITDNGAKLLLEHIEKYSELNIDGNPNISLEINNKIRTRLGKKALSNEAPIGIDLGCNYQTLEDFSKIHNLPDNSDLVTANTATAFEKKPAATFPSISPKLSREHQLANKLFEAHATEILSLSHSEKEEFIKHFSKSVGVDLDTTPRPAQKV